MNNRWMKMSVLALSMSAITGTLYANNQVAQTEAEVQNTTVVSDASTGSVVTSATDSVQEASTTPATDVVTTEPAPIEAANTGANQAATALQKKKVMRLKRQICKKYLLQMSANIH